MQSATASPPMNAPRSVIVTHAIVACCTDHVTLIETGAGAMRTTELSHSSNVTELLRFIIARVQPVPVAFSWPVAFSLWPASSLRGLICSAVRQALPRALSRQEIVAKTRIQHCQFSAFDLARIQEIPVGCGDRVKRRPAKVQPPWAFQLGRRCVETSGDVIRETT